MIDIRINMLLIALTGPAMFIFSVVLCVFSDRLVHSDLVRRFRQTATRVVNVEVLTETDEIQHLIYLDPIYLE